MAFGKNCFMTALAVFALTASSAVPAQGWSIGFGIGEAEAEDFCDSFNPNWSCDDTDTATKLFVGRDVNANLRIEGFWIDLGEVQVTDFVGDSIQAEADGIGGAAMGILPATGRLDLFGKFGLFSWDADASITISGSTSPLGDDDGIDPFFGGGFRYRAGDQFSIRGEWEEFDLDGDDVTVLSISGEAHF